MKLGNPKKTRRVWNWTVHTCFLVYADDVNVLGDNRNTVKRCIETLSVIGSDVTVDHGDYEDNLKSQFWIS